MAPWPVRKDSLARVEAATPRAHATSFDVPRSSTSYPVGHDDDSSSSDSLHPSRPGKAKARPRHARSISNPFPSFFSVGKKNTPERTRDRQPSWDSFTSDDELPGRMGNPGPQGEPPRRSRHQGYFSRDFASGSCMTCGSHVRWPKELKTFRCTICLTINDLAPRPTGDSADTPADKHRGTSPHAGPSGPWLPHLPVKPISYSHTKWMTRQCLRSFLRNSLGCEESLLRESNIAGGERKIGSVAGIQTDVPIILEHSQTPCEPQSTQSAAAESENFLLPPTSRGARENKSKRSYSSSYPERPSMNTEHRLGGRGSRPQFYPPDEGGPRIFRSLEDYIMSTFGSLECLNSSFPTGRNHVRNKSTGVTEGQRAVHRRGVSDPMMGVPGSEEFDSKLLMVGNAAENSTWRAGSRPPRPLPRGPGPGQGDTRSHVSHRSPHIDWDTLQAWYDMVIHPAKGWRDVCDEILSEYSLSSPSMEKLEALEQQILSAQLHLQDLLLRATEGLLRHPGRPITDPGCLRFLLIVLRNPLLDRRTSAAQGSQQPRFSERVREDDRKPAVTTLQSIQGLHLGILKRILGLIAQSPVVCHEHLVSWLARLPRRHFKQIKELVGSFLTYLLRQGKTRNEAKADPTGGLIPNLNAGWSTSALRDALEAHSSPDVQENASGKRILVYNNDWQVRAASQVMALIFAANNVQTLPRRDVSHNIDRYGGPAQSDDIQARGQILPTSDFYNPLLDLADLIVDFETWESKRDAFSFCQYPFLLSIPAKTAILEHEARRQMRSKERDAFFDSILNRTSANQYWVLKVRRECLVEDSLKSVSEIAGSGSDDIKKSLRIAFLGEEGIDHGGLRKEWFLLLVREIFNPDNGVFIHEEDSNHCYFNPYSFETSDQFFLVGVVMGLAIYNSTILDIPLPPFAFRKLLATGPAPPLGPAAHPKPTLSYGLDDLAEIRPHLANGLRQLLEYDGNVEDTFALDFTISVNKYGTSVQVPLLPDGADQPVTNRNRRRYVDLYIRYVLDVSVKRQFEPFKRGFYTVCGGNALTLFRPEEIELLVRGSDEALDVAAIRGAAIYENWRTDTPDDGSEPAVEWFWEAFERAAAADQRRLLLFVTGSDRIPAAGASSLRIKISCLGDDSERFPIARTCFNMLVLWRYSTREKLERKLWMAAYESEGFGLK